MASQGDDARGSGRLPQQRPSNDVEDPENHSGPYTMPDPTRATPSSQFLPGSSSQTPISQSVTDSATHVQSIHNGARDENLIPGDHGGVLRGAQASGSGTPNLTLNTAQPPPSSFASNIVSSPESLASDANAFAGPSDPSRRSTISPISPTSRSRGYSLRRSIFAKGITRPSNGMIELTEAGPSSQIMEEQAGNPPRNDGNPKKRGSTVVVTPIDPPSELPPRPDSKKKMLPPFRTIPLPNYDNWLKKRKRPAFITKIEDSYRVIKKRVLRIKVIPPSKDGRHIDIDPYRTEQLTDERRNGHYISNVINSCRYTPWNFLPKQIIFQFGKLANFYFLIISILQMIPGLSTTGTFTTFAPLLVFISISIAKEGYDDIRRFKLDKAENRRETSVLKPADHSTASTDLEAQASSVPAGSLQWVTKQWQEIKVGDIVKLNRDDSIPADILLLHSDGMNGVAYIETMALDGETNLKPKQAPLPLAKTCTDIDGISRCKALVVTEDPNIDLYNFEGRITVDGETLPLTTNEIVYRGSILRNTSEAFGMVINTGEECKIRMNANKNPRIKAPHLQTMVNKVVVILVVVVLFMTCMNTIAYQVWSKRTERRAWYLNRAHVPTTQIVMGFLIMFNTMIPLSLYVSMEIIKLGQLFLMQDVDMYDPVSNTPFESHTTTINEELGQISYIFSDKTGTLTDNVMRFRKLTVAGVAWLHDADLRKEAEGKESAEVDQVVPNKGKFKASRKLTESESESTAYFSADYSIDQDNRRRSMSVRSVAESHWKSTARPAKAQPELNTGELLEYLHHRPNGVFARKARFFLLSLALCHTCLPETRDDGSIDFQASSPDELALVRAAQDLGYMVVDRAAQTITLRIQPNGPEGDEISEVYEILDIIEFSSKRKRMSIIVRFPDGRRCVFCKGADTIVMKRLKLANLALNKAAEVERRASIRKSLEAEHALRRQSESTGIPRRSLTLGRTSMGDRPRRSLSGHKLQPIRDQLDAWLGEREHDVDLSSVDNPAAYTNPKRSLHLESRPSFAASSLHHSEIDDGYWDELVDESIATNEIAVFERCFQHIDDFATEGLRTLLYAYRFLDEQEYLGWKKIYKDATTSLVDRQERIEQAGDMIEQDFELAGATAIEDKLQKGVPETIDKLRRANIKMWMLTGDKRETAINIGHSCRLIKDYSKVLILNHEQDDLDQAMARALLEIRKGGVAHSVVVVDGQTLADIECDDTLSALFLDLSVISDSVICCRASPSQKALLVKKIRLRVLGSVTLAIGDGANDIAMIQEAHVGIGITGKEGLQAARVSDYAFAQFRFLQKLLLVHGRWNYVRTAKYVLGTFWKEMLFYLTQALYQHVNGYSGTSLYESWSLSMFNTLFTSIPVIFLGIFEQDLRATTLLAVPELYTMGQRNQAFNLWKYLGWTVMAIVEALFIFFIMYCVYALPSFGKDNGIFAIGDLSFSCCVIIINTKLLFIEMHRKTWICVFGWLLSVVGWTIWNLFLSLVYSNKASLTYAVRAGFIKHFGGNGIWWLMLHLIVSIFLIFELAVIYTRKTFWETDTDAFQRLEQDKIIKVRLEAAAEGIDIHDLPDEKDKGKVPEGEIQELLNSPRVTGSASSREPSNEVERRRGPSLHLSPIETGKQWVPLEDMEPEDRSAARAHKRGSILRHTEP